ARSIVLDDFLNATFTNGKAFYFTPLYRYFLAAAHWLTGESLFFVLVLQGAVLLGATLIMVYFLGKRLFSKGVGIVALVFLFMLDVRLEIFSILLGEPVATFLCLTSLMLVLRSPERPSSGGLVLSGILFGMAIGTRPNLLLTVAPVFAWL